MIQKVVFECDTLYLKLKMEFLGGLRKMMFVILLQSLIVDGNINQEDARYKAIIRDLADAGDIKIVDDRYIHLAVIIANVDVKDLVSGIINVFRDMLGSLFSTSTGRPLHLIMLTDAQSKNKVEESVVQSIGQFLSESVIRTVTHLKFEDHQTIHILPEIKVEFVDIDSIVAPNRAAIQEMKKLYSKKEAINIGINETFTVSVSPKYTQDLFYIGPFYSSAFSSLNRLVVLDADVMIKEDIGGLYNMFQKMSPSEMIGVALDQNGYYKDIADMLRKWGLLGLAEQQREQGINTGVVLYDLAALRKSEVYQREVEPSGFTKLSKSFQMSEGIVGDQEWFNLMSWRHPSMFKILGCEFNLQEAKISYHQYAPCTTKTKILHVHGKIHDK